MDRFNNLIEKFVLKNFPVTKVKKEGSRRFKRGIIVDGGFTGANTLKLYINSKGDMKLAFELLFKIVYKVFGSGKDIIVQILLNHLSLNQ